MTEKRQTYKLMGKVMVCLLCGHTTSNPMNVANRYCRECGIVHENSDEDDFVSSKPLDSGSEDETSNLSTDESG